MKKIIFIPPNGEMFINDFSIERLGKYFKNDKKIHTTLIKIKNKNSIDKFEYVDSIIDVESKKEILKILKSLKYDVIFHRSWMFAYPFAKTLVKKFDNVIVNIKDWEISTKKEYKVMYGEKAVDDFKAIKYIFKNARVILSHYTDKQAEIWAKKYGVNKNKFIFFPEYCNEENFNFRTNIVYKNPKLVLGGTLAPSSFPEEISAAKSHFRAMKKITKLGIGVDYVLTAGAYAGIKSPKNKMLFQDILYENQFNDNFSLFKGKTLDSSILNQYQFGFFLLEYCTKNEYKNRYAIPSKFAFYLESGLPILANKKLKALSYYVKKYNLGIVFSNDDIKKFNQTLDISQKDYTQMVENIYQFRKKFIFNFDGII